MGQNSTIHISAKIQPINTKITHRIGAEYSEFIDTIKFPESFVELYIWWINFFFACFYFVNFDQLIPSKIVIIGYYIKGIIVLENLCKGQDIISKSFWVIQFFMFLKFEIWIDLWPLIIGQSHWKLAQLVMPIEATIWQSLVPLFKKIRKEKNNNN